MAGYFPGTNIPLDDFKGSADKKRDLIARLGKDLANKDIKGMNDAIFSVAYWSKGGEGQGQGNANVSKVHNGTWQVNAGAFEGSDVTWAEDNVNSEGDGYVQAPGSKKAGKTVEFSDTSGVLVDGVSTGNWGGWDNTEQWTNPVTGAVENNPYHFAGPGGSGTPIALPTAGTEVDTGGYPDPVLTGNPLWATTDYTAPGADPKWTQNTTSLLGGAEGATDLAAYRPWTQNYWDTYVPKASQGLLKMGKPQRDWGLAYLPGEMRDPVSWAAGAGGGGTGHVPGGGWRFTPESYTTQTNPATGQPYASGTQPRAPWRFTSGAPQASNIYNTPWTAKSMNLNKAQGTDWANFLSSIDTSPTITPGLLSSKKGGPIDFGT